MATNRVEPSPTPRSSALQAPPLVSEHGRGGGYVIPKKAAPKTKTVVVKSHTRTVQVPPAVDPITAQINAAQLPQVQAIKDAQTESERAAKQQAANTSDYYMGLSNILKGIGPATQAGYTTAAANDAAFGKGFSTGLQDVQNTMQGEATNLAGISGGTAPAPPGAGASDALYALGGYIPASTMNREGAAFGAAANMLPATSARQGADAITQIQSKQALEQKGFQQKYAELAAQVPGLRLQYQQAADAQAIAMSKQRLAVAKAHADDVYRSSMLQLQYIAATGVDPRTGKLTPKAKLAYDKAMNDIKVANNKVVIEQQNADSSTSRAESAATSADASASRARTAKEKAQGYYLDDKGNPHAVAGFTLHPNGTVTKNPTVTTKWAPAQSVLSSVGQMRTDGYDEQHIAGQLKRWHPNWTSSQIAAALKAAPKLFGDMTKEQVTALRARTASLHTGWKFNPKSTASQTITIGGKTFKKGDTIPPVPYSAAVTFLVSGGYSRRDAMAMLNRFYAKGKRK